MNATRRPAGVATRVARGHRLLIHLHLPAAIRPVLLLTTTRAASLALLLVVVIVVVIIIVIVVVLLIVIIAEPKRHVDIMLAPPLLEHAPRRVQTLGLDFERSEMGLDDEALPHKLARLAGRALLRRRSILLLVLLLLVVGGFIRPINALHQQLTVALLCLRAALDDEQLRAHTSTRM